MEMLEITQESEVVEVSPGSGRFQIDRINSIEAGCSQHPIPTPRHSSKPKNKGDLQKHPVSSLGEAAAASTKEALGVLKNLDAILATPLSKRRRRHNSSSSSLIDKKSVSDQIHQEKESQTIFDTNNNNNKSIANSPYVKHQHYKNQNSPNYYRPFIPPRKNSPHYTNIGAEGSAAGAIVRKMSAARRISSTLNPLNITRRKSSIFIPSLNDDQYNATIGLYGKSLHNYTHDALPKMDNYRNLMSLQAASRPTLDELHDEEMANANNLAVDNTNDAPSSSSVKFGWIEGVFVRCILNIWGVMLFLRLTWMVGESGIISSIIIILISTLVTIVTTLSMSAASTNGEIKGGGLYYMISRSLGPEFGGAVGVVFGFANAAMAALNIVGFSEAVISFMAIYGVKIVDGGQNDNRIISVITIIVLQSIIIIGMEWEAKAQLGLLVILLAAMANFLVGSALGPQSDEEKAQGWIGLNNTVFMANMAPAYTIVKGVQHDFFSIFGVFFPSVSGIQAGVSISGDLKNPSEAIPKGTLLAIIVTSASYILFACIAGAGTLRAASGNVTQLDDWSFADCLPEEVYHCKSGLYYDYDVIGLMSSFGPLIYGGCFAACLSSALSCLVAGPKTFQALCKDEIYPGMTRFGIGYGKSDDPYWGYGLGFIIAIIFILIADLDAIAPLISNFFMAAYALLNYCVFHAFLIKPIGWRPTFKYCNAAVSLFGVVICIVVMFLMSWAMALASLVAVVVTYSIVLYRKPELNWGTSVEAQTYSSALSALQNMATHGEHAKTYRPQILCLSGFPSNRPALVDFAHLITKNNSLLLCANISEDQIAAKFRRLYVSKAYDWLLTKKVKSFYTMIDGCKFDDGCKALIQSTGVGKLAPNIMLMGYKANWQICHSTEVQEYFNCLHAALDNHLSVAILRYQDGLDVSDAFGHADLIVSGTNIPTGVGTLFTPAPESASATPTLPAKLNRFTNIMAFDSTDPEGTNKHSTATNGNGSPMPAKKRGNKLIFSKSDESSTSNSRKKGKTGDNNATAMGVYRGPDDNFPQYQMSETSVFQSKQGKGTVDVYWLYDDGGLTLLLPYIITMRKKWAQCTLRVFALANKASETEIEYRSMASLLSKFRIDYSELTVIPDITKRADSKTKELFESLIKDHIEEGNKDDPDAFISEGELLGLKEKTNRHLRLRELLLEHSSKSNLIVMTLPVPRKGVVSAFLYMAWLEILTRDMPPFLLVRGNQTSVLTFYS